MSRSFLAGLHGGACPGRETLYSGISVPLHFTVASGERGSMRLASRMPLRNGPSPEYRSVRS